MSALQSTCPCGRSPDPGIHPDGGCNCAPRPNTQVEREVFYAKDHLLRQIEHLRREVDYDYPPVTFAASMRNVQRAKKHYADVWQARAREQRARR